MSKLTALCLVAVAGVVAYALGRAVLTRLVAGDRDETQRDELGHVRLFLAASR